MTKKMQSVQHLTFYAIETESTLPKKFIGNVKAGFPSPAGDFMNEIIDLNKYVTLHHAATYYARANGVSMEGDINDGDLLVIDKSITPTNGKIAICYIDGEFTVKRIKIDKEGIWLMPTNERFKPILVTESNDLRIWGVVTHVIKKV
jgi:DNA polymerase V